MSNELPPLPDDIEQAIYERSLAFVPQAAHRAIEQLMREYGRACERAAYMRAAAACLAQRNPPPVLIADRVQYDPANAMAERCAAVISLLGADK